MTSIYNNDTIQIIKNKKKFSIVNDNLNQSQSDDLELLLDFFSLVDISYRKEKNDIQLNAKSIQTLDQFIKSKSKGNLNYLDVLSLLKNISAQIFYLEKKEKSILFFDLHDILVIDSSYYIFVNTNNIYDIYDIHKKNIQITTPIPLKSPFLAPELKQKLTLPLDVYYTSCIYSLALIIIYCIYGEKVTADIANEKITSISMDKTFPLLDSIYPTKLYYFLLRCLLHNPTDREFIYI
jgi:hypothetical protein